MVVGECRFPPLSDVKMARFFAANRTDRCISWNRLGVVAVQSLFPEVSLGASGQAWNLVTPLLVWV
jgi:hypothetical protein